MSSFLFFVVVFLFIKSYLTVALPGPSIKAILLKSNIGTLFN